MSRKLGSISALVLCAAALLVTTATGAASKVVAHKSRSGPYAAVGAHATVKRPHSFALRVFANPRQLVNGNWLVVCKRGRVRGTKVGRMNGRTPVRKKVPVALNKATSCTVSAEAVLTKKGKVTLVLYAY
jgi:hypothetical protein